MNKYKYRMRRKWRHFKFWLVKKLFPDGSLDFLVNPYLFDLGLTQIDSERRYKRSDYEFINVKHIKEVIISQMMPNLVNHLEYEIEEDGDYVVCKGELTIAERKVS